MNAKRLKAAALAAGLAVLSAFSSYAGPSTVKPKTSFAAKKPLTENKPWHLFSTWGRGTCKIDSYGITYSYPDGKRMAMRHVAVGFSPDRTMKPHAVYCSDAKTYILWAERLERRPGADKLREGCEQRHGTLELSEGITASLLGTFRRLPFYALGGAIAKTDKGLVFLIVGRKSVSVFDEADDYTSIYQLWQDGTAAPASTRAIVGNSGEKFRIFWPGYPTTHFVMRRDDDSIYISQTRLDAVALPNPDIKCIAKGCKITVAGRGNGDREDGQSDMFVPWPKAKDLESAERRKRGETNKKP